MAQKFFTFDFTSKAQKLIEAITASAGAADGGKIVATDPTTGLIDASLLPSSTSGADTANRTASEALSASNIVNVWNDSGTPKARKADASALGKRAVGFVSAAVSSGATATVNFEGTIAGLSGLVPGDTYFLSATTPGAITNTPPSASGSIVQSVGVAISDTELSFEPGEPILLA
jgi:hypothetical protein